MYLFRPNQAKPVRVTIRLKLDDWGG